MEKGKKMILVTGASGLVGKSVVDRLAEQPLILAGRRQTNFTLPFFDLNLDNPEGIGDLPSGVNVIVHAAARVHMMNERAHDSESEYTRVNTEGTLSLARLAAKKGVRRFVFISTIKVNGEKQCRGQPFSAYQPPSPEDPYARSKYQAEAGLRELAQETGMEVVIIRPPLVYGPGVKANFERLVKLVQQGVPLPLMSVKNLRSLVGVENLADLIAVSCFHKRAGNETFLVSDNEDVSTAELIRRIGKSCDRKARLLPVPESILRLAGKLTGKSEQVHRLCSSLQVDIEHTMKTLDWKPRYSMQDQLDKTVEDYKQRNR